MIEILTSQPVVKKSELAQRLETNPRNIIEIKRDLEAAGYVIDYLPGPHGGYRLDRSRLFRLPELTRSESDALQPVFSALLISGDPLYGDRFKQALSKLNYTLHRAPQPITYSQRRQLDVDQQFYQHCLDTIIQASSSFHRLRMIYQPHNRPPKEYVIEPYYYLLYEGIWYVFAYIKGGRFSSFKVNRIRKVELLEETFVFSETQAIQRLVNKFGYTDAAPIDLHVRIDDLSYISEYIWGENQRIEWLDDHSFEMWVTFGNQFNLFQFLREVQANCTIHAPAWVIDAVKAEARTVLSRYT